MYSLINIMPVKLAFEEGQSLVNLEKSMSIALVKVLEKGNEAVGFDVRDPAPV